MGKTDIGRFITSMGSALLKIGVTLTVFQQLGNTFREKDRLINFVIEGAINGAASLLTSK